MNVVYDDDSWVLQRLGDRICKETGWSHGIPVARETNLYLPYYLLGDGTRRDICLFTHREESPHLAAKTAKFDEAARHADLCVAMSERTARHLPREKTCTLELPPDPLFGTHYDKLIGVSGHAQPGDRKALDRIEIAKKAGFRVKFTGGDLLFEQLPYWYSTLDYLLITGKVEGGPLPVKEAIAMGVPVIAPDVGWCWDYPVIRYENDAHLARILAKLNPGDEWPGFIEKLKEVCS